MYIFQGKCSAALIWTRGARLQNCVNKLAGLVNKKTTMPYKQSLFPRMIGRKVKKSVLKPDMTNITVSIF